MCYTYTMKKLPEKFIERMETMLESDAAAFFDSYEKEPVRGLRVNTLKTTPDAFAAASPFALSPSDIIPEGFVLEEKGEGIGNHPYHLAGLFYMQEPSAMSAIAAVDPKPGMKILDLCAAPGGKSGGIAARLNGEGLIVSNEIVPNRAKTLSFTMERLGVPNAVVTCAHPDALCTALEGYFDAVLVDAPCSGEGMFRKDDGAIAEWSPEHVEACAARQQAILASAYRAVKQGGALVYSTCTFSREENEDTVERFVREHADMEIEFMHRLYPHTCRGEGHFVARLIKNGGEEVSYKNMKLTPCRDKEYASFIKDTFEVPPKGQAYSLKDGRIIILREELPGGLEGLRILSAGIYAGDIQKGRFMPSHTLFLAAHGGKLKHSINLAADSGELRAYLSGNTIPVDESYKGWCEVCVNGHPLGFGKAVEGTLKNHLPKGLRVL